MLLDEVQMALNELLVNYTEAADHFEDAIGFMQHDDLKALFEKTRDDHIDAVNMLSAEVRKTGILPRAQNADREQVHQILTHVKAAFSDNEQDVFLNDRIEHELRIQNEIEQTLQLPVASDTRDVLETLKVRQSAVLAELKDALHKNTQ